MNTHWITEGVRSNSGPLRYSILSQVKFDSHNAHLRCGFDFSINKKQYIRKNLFIDDLTDIKKPETTLQHNTFHPSDFSKLTVNLFSFQYLLATTHISKA